MTPIRKLALKISNTVVRYASPGCKEWAEGLAREVAFVEGDWAALAWALGSVRVLFDYRETPIASLADVPAAAQKFAKAKRSGNGTWILSFYFILDYGDKFFHAANGLERIGCAMVVLGWILVGPFVYIEWRNEIKMPPSDDISALIQFYKTRLERVRDFHRSPKFWMMTSALAFFSVGMVLAQPVLFHNWGFGGLCWVSVLLLFLQLRRNNRRRLERLNALLAETPIDR